MLKDIDIMPFGKFKGIKLANVPGSYLLWLKGEIEHIAPNKRSAVQSALMKYIIDNEEILKNEKSN